MSVALFISVLAIAACGLIYELVASALASYLLGDSVLQFSTVIGTYLFAMGVGSWLSRYLGRGLVARFIGIELIVGVIGGFSSTVLFLAFAYTSAFRLVLYVLVVIIGVLVGLEIPLLMRVLRDRYAFKDVVSNVLTFDYLGALAASLAFPILLVPKLGLVRSAMLFGLVNAGIALWSTFLFADLLGARRALRGASAVVLAVLTLGMTQAKRITTLAEDNIYADEVIFSRDTRYQHIVLTAWKDDLRLFLNSHLQFSSRDEYRYHEALVHPGLAAVPGARHVLVLGGGDGLAVREILKYPNVEKVTLVDLDPEMTRLFTTHPLLTRLNAHSLTSPKVHVINADAFVWLNENTDVFDFVVVDFPDPNNYGVGKLYTSAFYRALERHVRRAGLIVVQSTSPLFARQSFWSIVETLKRTGLKTYPYHVYVPSFGEWGFTLASAADGPAYAPPPELPPSLRFLAAPDIAQLFTFPRDMQPVAVEPNRLNDQVLVRYYEKEFEAINR
ncbi:MAG TPA: polyamine aminopropyltransferase [Gemmatimonadaceae bacterium]|nr:polyamine aminopropyltransferase [Gemmatimonadaceae bacterium]